MSDGMSRRSFVKALAVSAASSFRLLLAARVPYTFRPAAACEAPRAAAGCGGVTAELVAAQ